LDATPWGEENGGSLGNTRVTHEGRGTWDTTWGRACFLGLTRKLSRDGGGGGQGQKKDEGRDFGLKVGLWGVVGLGD
jgi:hypothetical protein